MERDYACRLVKLSASCAALLSKLFGDCATGIALVEAHYCNDDPWLTPQQVAVRCHCSDDTARRRLEALVSIGRVRRQELASGRKAYRTTAKVAERACKALHTLTQA